jgi:hypothetical protein
VRCRVEDLRERSSAESAAPEPSVHENVLCSRRCLVFEKKSRVHEDEQPLGRIAELSRMFNQGEREPFSKRLPR